MTGEPKVHDAGVLVVGRLVAALDGAQIEADLLGEPSFAGIFGGGVGQDHLNLDGGESRTGVGRLEHELVITAAVGVGHLDGEHVTGHLGSVQLERIGLPVGNADDHR